MRKLIPQCLAAAIAAGLCAAMPAHAGNLGDGQSHTVRPGDAAEQWNVSGNGAQLLMLPGSAAHHILMSNGATASINGRVEGISSFGAYHGMELHLDSKVTAGRAEIISTQGAAVVVRTGSSFDSFESTLSGESYGVALVAGGTATFTGSSVTASAASGDAIYFGDDMARPLDTTKVELSRGSTASGPRHAVNFAFDASSGLHHEMIVDGSHLQSATGSAISASGANSQDRGVADIMLRNGSTVAAGNGVLLETSGTAIVNLAIDNSAISGDIFNDATATTHVRLQNKARLTGAMTNVSSLVLNDATWNVTGDSSVDRLTLGNGTVAFAAPSSGGYKTLNVAGEFIGSGGTIIFNTVLAGDNAASDKLVIGGNTSGSANVQVKNVGGAGAQTSKGIELINVGGASNGVFTLAGRAVGGQYEYFLHKGTGTDGNWYLRSQMQEPCTVDPSGPWCDPDNPGPMPDPDVPYPLPDPERDPYPLPDPERDPYPLPDPERDPYPLPDPERDPYPLPGPQPETPDPEEPYPLPSPDPEGPNPQPVLRPEGGAYLANLQAAQSMFQLGYHERSAGQNGGNSWVRVDGSRLGFDAVSRQLDIHGNSQALSVGTDVWRTEGGSSVGVMLSSGNATSTATNGLTGYYARGKVKGEALGVYGTWRGGNVADPYAGFYVDGSLQRAQFRNRVEGVGLEAERYKSRAWQGALEAGYAFRVGGADNGGIYLEPQLQLGYNRWSDTRHSEVNGTVVTTDDANGLFGRAGMRLSGTTRWGNGAAVVQPYIAVSWLHSRAEPAVLMDDERVDARIPRNRAEFSGGAALKFANGVGVFSGLSLQSASGYHKTSAQLGVNYSW